MLSCHASTGVIFMQVLQAWPCSSVVISLIAASVSCSKFLIALLAQIQPYKQIAPMEVGAAEPLYYFLSSKILMIFIYLDAGALLLR